MQVIVVFILKTWSIIRTGRPVIRISIVRKFQQEDVWKILRKETLKLFLKLKSDIGNKTIKKTFKMFRSKEFQRAVMPLIIVNSIFYIGLLEYFVDRRIRTIGFFYIIGYLIYYSILIYTFKDIVFIFRNAQETKMSGIITYIQFFEYTFLYIILVFIGIAKRQVKILNWQIFSLSSYCIIKRYILHTIIVEQLDKLIHFYSG